MLAFKCWHIFLDVIFKKGFVHPIFFAIWKVKRRGQWNAQKFQKLNCRHYYFLICVLWSIQENIQKLFMRSVFQSWIERKNIIKKLCCKVRVKIAMQEVMECCFWFNTTAARRTYASYAEIFVHSNN